MQKNGNILKNKFKKFRLSACFAFFFRDEIFTWPAAFPGHIHAAASVKSLC